MVIDLTQRPRLIRWAILNWSAGLL